MFCFVLNTEALVYISQGPVIVEPDLVSMCWTCLVYGPVRSIKSRLCMPVLTSEVFFSEVFFIYFFS